MKNIAGIIFLAVLLLSCENGDDQQSGKSMTFESEGMRLSLEELIRGDDVVWVSVFKQMGQMFGLAKGVFCSSFSYYAGRR